MDVKKLQEMNKHKSWLRGEEGGERADLRGADLTRANLTDANLTDANLTDADLRGANLRGANLTRADLRGANLTRADLRGADLTDADLTDADLTRANLTDANLTDANLTDANLTDADLRGANLTRADLRGANLTRADLRGANLTRADLRGANLTDANLNVIKHDLWSILLPAQAEIDGLVNALNEGRVDGSTYQGECACLVGTIANVRGVMYDQLVTVKPDAERPAERWFLGIREGDTPENSAIAKLTMEWIEEFLSYISTKS